MRLYFLTMSIGGRVLVRKSLLGRVHLVPYPLVTVYLCSVSGWLVVHLRANVHSGSCMEPLRVTLFLYESNICAYCSRNHEKQHFSYLQINLNP